MDFSPEESLAKDLDAQDPLASYRELFHLPAGPDGRPLIYFCGHSLGLQPRSVGDYVQQELADWARLGVDGHFHGKNPWYDYHELFRESGARLVGARPGEVVMMNSLTVNLHLMLTTFYRPTRDRYKILIDEPAFPSDLYALQSQVRLHGYDPGDALAKLVPRPGEHSYHTHDIEGILRSEGHEIALVFLNGVNFFTGQFFDLSRLTSLASEQGCVVGYDLAHAAGNVLLQLHDWDVDFAVWCNYKYLNSGPGAVGGCFVHERHGQNFDLPRLAGWWGNDPATRFQMPDKFVPRLGADGWQISNPPIFSLAPVRASLAIFDQACMPALRAKSEQLTRYLENLLDQLPPGRFEIVTPRDSRRRGCQLSILVHDRPRELMAALKANGVVCDFREPDVLRLAPVPLYNSFHEVWSFVRILEEVNWLKN
jgi:kynureninase